MAKFLQETLEEIGTMSSKKAEAAKQFTEFFHRVTKKRKKLFLTTLKKNDNVF
jgi:hypothetical protein